MFQPQPGNITFVEIGHEIISTSADSGFVHLLLVNPIWYTYAQEQCE